MLHLIPVSWMTLGPLLHSDRSAENYQLSHPSIKLFFCVSMLAALTKQDFVPPCGVNSSALPSVADSDSRAENLSSSSASAWQCQGTHSTSYASLLATTHDINVMDFPAFSPYMSPIEHIIWDEFGCRIYSRNGISNLQQLEAALKEQ
ncbi:transposable element tc3 transposase [Plakobranchus ocellatus]|uniref:Transposable element tc3 transposase n=1 Tax=Plakobranchus ocellatus TaxID=259542 RepID=A0AAV3ZKW3_9GAST|nr:transposable element tc3 transposase [Plakobranchus ocellatus]